MRARNGEPHRDTSVPSETCIANVYTVHSRQLTRQPSACECRSRVAQYSGGACRGRPAPVAIIGQLSVCSLHQIRGRVPVPHVFFGDIGIRKVKNRQNVTRFPLGAHPYALQIELKFCKRCFYGIRHLCNTINTLHFAKQVIFAPPYCRVSVCRAV